MNGLVVFILCQLALLCAAMITGASCGAGLADFMDAKSFEKLHPSCMMPYLIMAWIIIIVAAYYLWNSKLIVKK